MTEAGPVPARRVFRTLPDQPDVPRPHHGAAAPLDRQLREQALQVVLDGIGIAGDPPGDLLVGQSLGEKVEDLVLARPTGRNRPPASLPSSPRRPARGGGGGTRCWRTGVSRRQVRGEVAQRFALVEEGADERLGAGEPGGDGERGEGTVAAAPPRFARARSARAVIRRVSGVPAFCIWRSATARKTSASSGRARRSRSRAARSAGPSPRSADTGAAASPASRGASDRPMSRQAAAARSRSPASVAIRTNSCRRRAVRRPMPRRSAVARPRSTAAKAAAGPWSASSSRTAVR